MTFDIKQGDEIVGQATVDGTDIARQFDELSAVDEFGLDPSGLRHNQDLFQAHNTPFCTNSFPSGVDVLLADGRYVPIEQISTGTEVAALNPATRRIGSGTVTDHWGHAYSGSLITIHLVDGGSVTSTADHLLRTPWTGGWTEADEVQPGDMVRTSNGLKRVASITGSDVDQKIVWDITVEPSHNFVARDSGNGVVVHNADCYPKGSPEHRKQRWEEYQDRPNSDLTQEQWNNVYDANLNRATAANMRMDAVADQLGLPPQNGVAREVVPPQDPSRRFDIADQMTNRAWEHKSGDNTYLTQAVQEQIVKNQVLTDQWTIVWLFDGKASQPLKDALDAAGIAYWEDVATFGPLPY